MEVKEYILYEYTCSRCGRHQDRDYLIKGKFLECNQCHFRFYKDEHGQWQVFEDKTEIVERKIRRKKAGLIN